jgi:hypothetical protein
MAAFQAAIIATLTKNLDAPGPTLRLLWWLKDRRHLARLLSRRLVHAGFATVF